MHTYPGPGGDLHAQLTRGEQIHLEMNWEEPTRYRLSNEASSHYSQWQTRYQKLERAYAVRMLECGNNVIVLVFRRQSIVIVAKMEDIVNDYRKDSPVTQIPSYKCSTRVEKIEAKTARRWKHSLSPSSAYVYRSVPFQHGAKVRPGMVRS